MENLFRVNRMFQDNMVLQRGKLIPIWGTGTPGEELSIMIQGQTWTGKINTKGTWQIEIGPLVTSFEEEMLLTSQNEQICLKNVAVGEVWIAGGQSNMEYPMKYEQHYTEEVLNCANRNLRFFDYPEVSYLGEIEEKNFVKTALWRVCDQKNMPYFSAVGYYFQKSLEEMLQVPIGVIGCNWGGTPAAAWINPEDIRNCKGKIWIEEYENTIKDLDLKQYESDYANTPMECKDDWVDSPVTEHMLGHIIPKEELMEIERKFQIGEIPQVPMGPKNQNRPGGLYESMLCQIAPYGLRGAIWYQGESDESKADLYGEMFATLIQGWRKLWQEEIPFLFVQLAPYEGYSFMGGRNYPIVRHWQQYVADHVPNTGMAVITDGGLPYDIHPKNKKIVGNRLALQALAKVYGQNIHCESPMISGGKWKEDSLILDVVHTAGELVLKGEEMQGLVIMQGDKLISKYQFRLEGGQIVLWSNQWNANVETEIQVAQTAYYEINLYNKAGLPLRPGRCTVSAN